MELYAGSDALEEAMMDGRVARNWTAFLLVGIVLYGVLYAASEQLVYRYGHRNRFYMVSTAKSPRYDYVVLGASHAAVLDYDDMNTRLEKLVGGTVMNLSVVGGGVAVNQLVLDYFLARHRASTILYVTDSFAFYSRQWNEDRLNDTRLFLRAPFDAALARLLLRNPSSWSAGLSYVVGFAKINNPDRFEPDVSEDEVSRFSKTYRPVRQIDTERIAYLYPASIDPGHRQRYFAQFDSLVEKARTREIGVVVVKPPIPERVYRMLPDEASFDRDLQALASRHGVRVYDFSLRCNEEKFFFDTDHLNRNGVLNFYDNCLKEALPSGRGN